MADSVYNYQIDGILTDPSGSKTSLDGSFQVDYTLATVTKVNVQGYNIGNLTSVIEADGTTEYTVMLRYFPQGQTLINYANISYNTMSPGYADSASVTSGATSNPNGIPVGTDTYSAQRVPLAADAISVCFANGTRLRTSVGYVAVEDLRVGDLVRTSSGALRPIRWLGHRRLDCANHPHPDRVMPVRIAAHAFGPQRPQRDLVVSPGHGVAVDLLGEVLIPASSLINSATIRQERVEHCTYWHVELDSHDLVIAENLPTESYLDMGNRGFFVDGDVAVALHGTPDVRVTHADFCRPFHADGAIVAFVRERLAAHAKHLGWAVVECPLANLHLVVDGRRVEPEVRGLSLKFLLPSTAMTVWLASDATVPAQVGAGRDARTLGVCVARLAIGDGFGSEHAFAADDPRLCVGFHAVEAGPQRWTAGRALLPPALWHEMAGAFFLRIDLARPALPHWQHSSAADVDRVDPECICDSSASMQAA